MKVWTSPDFIDCATAANHADRAIVRVEHFGELFDPVDNPLVVERVRDAAVRRCANLILHRDHVARLKASFPDRDYTRGLAHERTYRVTDRCVGYDVALALQGIATAAERPPPPAEESGFRVECGITLSTFPGCLPRAPRDPVPVYEPPSADAVLIFPAIERRRVQEAALAAKLADDAETADDEATAAALAAASEAVTELSATLAADWITARADMLARAQAFAANGFTERNYT